MKIKVDGYRGACSQTKNIEKAFNLLGHAIVHDDPVDLLVNLNGLFNESENFYHSSDSKPVRLYNLLDVNNTSIGFYDECINHLNSAEIVTTISYKTKKDIQEKLGIDRQIEVIGFPMRPGISNLNYVKSLDFIWVGRIGGKRFDLAGETLRALGLNPNTLVVAGPERPPFGLYTGILSDSDLNELYNSARFVFLTSYNEGLGLSCIEGSMTQTWPILCNDNKVIEELGLEEFAADPHPVALAQKINKIVTNPDYYNKILEKQSKEFEKKFTVQAVAERILNLYNQYVSN